MTEYQIYSLYSGSGGNSLLMRAGGVNILIDAGKSARSLCRSLLDVGSDIENIDAIFITHEHADHISALEVLTRRHRIPVHMTEASAAGIPPHSKESLGGVLRLHKPLFSVNVGGVIVTSLPASHDSNFCVGYRIEFDGIDGTRRALGCATDTGYVTKYIREGLCGCEAVVIECNHDVTMLRCGPYPAYLKSRILSRRGHLSNDDCADFAAYLADRGTRHFLLAHVSRENNDPEIAAAAVRAAVPDENVRILVAEPDSPLLFVKKNSQADCPLIRESVNA